MLLRYLFLFQKTSKVIASAATDNSNVVISQIQIAGTGNGNANHDFIELYNPTSSTFSLNGFKLVTRSSSGATDNSVVNFVTGDFIAAHSYYLWFNTSIAGGFTCDKSTTDTVANNNNVALRDGALNTGIFISLVV